MKRVVVTGLGFITSIGNSIEKVVGSLQNLQHGFEAFPAREGEVCPPKLYGSIKEFDTYSSRKQDEWVYPDKYTIRRSQKKTMSPHVLYAHCATTDAIEDAGLSEDMVSNLGTGLYSSSAGSPVHQQDQLNIMNERGVGRCSPFCVITSTVGTVNFNLGATFNIKGAICGMTSACASSAHALGFAFDEIACGRQDRMIVVGAEDGNREALLPFAAMRALSVKSDPKDASCPFDIRRNGFVGSGGAVAMILESESVAQERSAKIYSEMLGWGQAADGHSPAISHPRGEGLQRAMELAIRSSNVQKAEVDYINAHGTSTQVGDLSEIRALRDVFADDPAGPKVSSTKALTGHGLSQAGALEGAITCLAISEGFCPGSAHLETVEEEGQALNIIRKTDDSGPNIAMSNSSGFGGANVSLVFRRFET